MSTESDPKKRKLEVIEESNEETDGACNIKDSDLVINAEADKFFAMFEKIFGGGGDGEKSDGEGDAEDGRARELLDKRTEAIKSKINATFKRKTAGKILKLLFYIAEIIINGEN